jgi:hypothetical protein
MMRLGILPTGHIYPREERAVRDLLRKRASLVRQRTANILSVQNLEQRNRGTKISSNEVKHLTPERVAELYDNEDLSLALTTTVKVIEVLTEQTRYIEKAVLKKAEEVQKRVDALERAIARRVTREQEDGMRAVMDAIHKVTNVTLVDRNRKP